MHKIKTLIYKDFINNRDKIKELLKLSYTSSFDLLPEITETIVSKKTDELEEYIKNNQVILIGAFIDDNLIGVIWAHIHNLFESKRIHISHIVTDEKSRNKGVAKELLLKIESVANDLGISTIELIVSESNYSALKMYEKTGFLTERRYLKKEL